MFVHTTVAPSVFPAPGWLAARAGMAGMLKTKSVEGSDRISFHPLLLLFRGGREMPEHFVHPFVEVLCVLVRIVGERIAR